jgi:hypothetical protein
MLLGSIDKKLLTKARKGRLSNASAVSQHLEEEIGLDGGSSGRSLA